MQPVGDSAEPASFAHDAPRVRPQHGVDAVAEEPGTLVEAVRGPARGAELTEDREPRALRRRPPKRKLEQHRLVRTRAPPPNDERPHPELERSLARGLLDLDDRPLCRAHEGSESAAVDHRETHAPPRPPAERERDRNGCNRDSRVARRRGDGDEHRGGERGRQDGDAEGRRRGQAHAERAAEGVAGTDAHGITNPFSWAMRPGPMPGTASSSSTEWNAPCACR